MCDTSAYDWSILSADSFVTYYAVESEPTPGADDLATNILPSIQGIDTASNAIVNGYFGSNADGWSISGTGWGRTSESMRSNVNNGDSGRGVLRSSAFDVSTNKYVRFDWAGGLEYDKRIFISVKEVGTNIELLRYVRRANLSTKKGDSFDNHMLNLSALDASKLYYLEFADNTGDGWGVSYVDSIRLVPKSEWDSVTSGDRAVLISGSVPFAKSFLELTAPICTAMSGDFSSVWSDLGTHYTSLSTYSKDIFTESATTDADIVDARERYVFIIGKYTSLTKFVVDGDNVTYLGAGDLIGYDIGESSRVILFVVLGVMLVSTGAFFIISRRRKYKM